MNKNRLLLSIAGGVSLLIGMLYFACAYHIIIIRMPVSIEHEAALVAMKKKECPIHYWHENAWHTEKMHLLWSVHDTTNIKQLLNGLFCFLQEENIFNKKITIDSVLLTRNNNDAYISFDHLPFTKEESIFEKWMRIESILKTIHTNIPSVQNVHFLISHKPMTDAHLDFSQPWPISGFC